MPLIVRSEFVSRVELVGHTGHGMPAADRRRRPTAPAGRPRSAGRPAPADPNRAGPNRAHLGRAHLGRAHRGRASPPRAPTRRFHRRLPARSAPPAPSAPEHRPSPGGAARAPVCLADRVGHARVRRYEPTVAGQHRRPRMWIKSDMWTKAGVSQPVVADRERCGPAERWLPDHARPSHHTSRRFSAPLRATNTRTAPQISGATYPIPARSTNRNVRWPPSGPTRRPPLPPGAAPWRLAGHGPSKVSRTPATPERPPRRPAPAADRRRPR